MKHLSIKFLLLTIITFNILSPIQAGRKPAGKRSPAQQQQYLAQQNRLRQAQLAQQEAARKEKEAQEAAELAAQQKIEQATEKQETTIATLTPAPQPQPSAPQVTESEAQPQDTKNQAEAMRYAQARAMQQKQALPSFWQLAYLSLAPAALQLLFNAFKTGTETTTGVAIKSFAGRHRSLKDYTPEGQKTLLEEHPSFQTSALVNQAFYQGMLSAAGSVVSTLIIKLIATGLQGLMPTVAEE